MRRAIVIGAGPAGAAAAMRLVQCGIETQILERKPLPRTKACGSGLSPWTLTFLDRIGVGVSVRQRAFRIDGAIIHGAQGPGLELRGDHETAILLRSEFDELLVRHAQKLGATLVEGCTVRGLEAHRGCVGVRSTAGEFEADIVIDCSGATGGLNAKRRPRAGSSSTALTLHTIMGWWQGVSQCSDVVELFFDQELRPHYGWIFPESEQRVNIGICFVPDKSKGNARQRFQEFLDRRLAGRLLHAEQLGSWIGHPVRTASVPSGLTEPGVLRAGEAGWLADSATAEGIYHALVSGTLAGQHVVRLNGESKRLDAEPLRYHARVAAALGPRLLGGRLLMGALRTPIIDVALRLQSSRATQQVLKKAFTGLYHG